MPPKKEKSNLIKLSENAKQEKFIEMSKKIQDGELEWVYYGLDGNISYHYYRKIVK
jgi:hypothetical protein